MRRCGVALGAWVFGVFLFGAKQEAAAMTKPATGQQKAAAAPETPAENNVQEPETPEVTDDMIVEVLVQTERIVQRTASLASKRPPSTVREEATELHANLGRMIRRLEGYAKQRGFDVPAANDPRSSISSNNEQFANLLKSLQGLETDEFNPVFLTILHEFLSEMVTIVGGAQSVASDSALKSMLVEMEGSLTTHRDRVGQLLLVHPMPPTHDVPLHP
jgi:hypothetical protein